MPDIINDENHGISRQQFKTLSKSAIVTECEKDLLDQIKSSSKLLSGDMIHENFSKKSYINDLTPAHARQVFKFRSKTINCKFNYKSDPKYSSELWRCNSCLSCIDSQQHVMICPAYAPLREGKNVDDDKDLSEYLMKVLIIRGKLEIIK